MVSNDTHTSDDAEALVARTHVPLSYQKQCVLDAVHRMRNGLLLYPAVWVVLMQVDNYATRHTSFAIAHGVALFLASAIRLIYNSGLKRTMERDFHRAQRLFRALSLLYNAYWGTLCAIILVAPDAETLRWLMLMSTVGITAGGTVIVAIDSVLPLLYPLCTLGPSVLVLLPRGGSVDLAISGLSAIFFAYSLGISRMVGREYWARQRSQALLEQRARELETISRTDALTRVPNRLKFQENLTVAWRDARRRHEPLSIAMVDLDYFKHINDSHGHPFGDLCLQAAAQGLSAVLRRPTDMVARYGGEEFVVLMPNTAPDGAMQVAQAMLDQIKQTYVSQDEHAAMLSCSIGVATWQPGSDDQAQALVQQADAALYQAKRAGRGRVMPHVHATPDASDAPGEPRELSVVA
ncbi:diguanylate cyclase domain-containing protein [Aquabacterium sp.]|uniref:diguanylate cyclase domain-containing protein n=1 Tax=Aquabacterium sp. TaxID=1872578 RepID=UPI0040381CAB